MNIIPMNYEGKTVRTITDGDKTLWVAKDVADVLGYVNTNDAISNHCKGVEKLYPLKTAGGMQKLRIIEEPDIYRLVAGSRLPTAQKFEKWIFEDILPTIRKTGSYQLQKDKPATLLPIDKEFRAAIRMAKAAGLKGNAAIISANNLTRRMTGSDCLLLLEATHLINEKQEQYFTATEIGMMGNLGSGQFVNKLLAKLGFQERVGNKWAVTPLGMEFAIILDTGKKHNDGTMVQQVKWKEGVLLALSNAEAA